MFELNEPVHDDPPLDVPSIPSEFCLAVSTSIEMQSVASATPELLPLPTVTLATVMPCLVRRVQIPERPDAPRILLCDAARQERAGVLLA